MLYIRFGSRSLFITTPDTEKLKNFFLETLDGIMMPFYEAINKGTEHCSIIFLLGPNMSKTSITTKTPVVFIPHGTSVAHSEIFNHGLAYLIESTQLGPGSIIMRVLKEGKGLMTSVKERYQAKEMDLLTAITSGNHEQTILSITNQSLHLPIELTNTITKPLLINEKTSILYDLLRKNGLLYITKEIDDNQWCELQINIYDVQGDYTLHYQRLIHVLSQLDLGMILGESWTRDHALSLFSVLAYQVRLFTLYSPIEIKALLKGLEYDDDGKRLVDFDLYYNNKKVSAAQLKTDTNARLKEEKGLYFRRKLMEELPAKSVEYLRTLEKQAQSEKTKVEAHLD